VFPSRGKTEHLTTLKKSWGRLRRQVGCPDLRIHDLRHTLGSWQAGLGTSLLIISKSLGHTNTGTTEIYANLNLDPIRASVAGAVKAMLGTRPRKQLRA
jgi:integrase